MRVNQQAGFTLIEAMVVVAIIGIIASIAVPSFSLSLSERRTQQAAADIVNAFNEARAQAALNGKAARLLIGDNNRSYTVHILEGKPAEAQANQTLSDKKMTSQYLLNESISVASNLNDKLTILILPTGRVAVKPIEKEAPKFGTAAQVAPKVSTLYFRVCDSRYSGESGYTVSINTLGVSRQIKGKVSVADDTKANSVTNSDCG